MRIPLASRPSLFRKFAVGILALGIALPGGFALAAPKKEKSSKEDEDFLRFVDVAGEIYKELRKEYVEEVPNDKLLEGAIRGMFSELDEHSTYLDNDTFGQLTKDTEGEFSGIGIHIGMRDGVLTVIAPIPGSPSAKLGIQPWDRIIEIEGKSTEGITVQDAVKKLTGPSGTKVSIKIYRPGEKEPLSFTVTRQTIKIDSVYHKMLDEKIGYLRLTRFSETTSQDMRAAIEDMKEKGMRALIFDLRFNSGGLLKEAVEVSQFFVPAGETIVSTRGRIEANNRKHVSKADPIVQVPVFVLINEGTASASEIVAGAIQDHHLGVVVGPEIDGKTKTSYGKGSVQTIEPLKSSLDVDKDGNPLPNAIKVTTAKYYTPNGRSIHHKGITPDIAIPLPKDFQRKLLQHGMLGDPSTVEPGTEGQEEEEVTPTETPRPTETPEAGEATATPADGATPTPSPTPDPNFYLKSIPKRKPAAQSAEASDETKSGTAAKDTPFDDIMLSQAVREMKVYLIMERAQAKRSGKSDPEEERSAASGARRAGTAASGSDEPANSRK